MKIINLYDYPKLEQVTQSDGKRHYNADQYKGMASVTTILSATGDKTALDAWRKRVGDKEAERVRKEATGLGSLMHEHLENYILETPRPGGGNIVRKMAERMADQIIEKGLCNITECWGQEVSVYFPDLYAGTIDFVGIHNGFPAIIDYKTSKKIKEMKWMDDYRCQSAGYATAHDELFGTKIRKIVIFMVTRDYEFKEYVFEGKDFSDSVNMWTKRVEEFYSK